MKKLIPAFFCLLFFSSYSFSCEKTLRNLSTLSSLTKLVEHKKPWETVEANSEQRQPYYIGSSPREFILEGRKKDLPSLPSFTQNLVETQSQILLKSLNLHEAQFEIWPFLTDQGDPNWVFARYRKDENSPWFWMESSSWKKIKNRNTPEPALPQLMNPQKQEDAKQLFNDFLEFDNLYQKPLFQEAIWTRQRAKEFLAGWISSTDIKTIQNNIAKDTSIRARILPQPARFNEEAISFIVHAREAKALDWGAHKINWVNESLSLPKSLLKIEPFSFSPDFKDRFIEDVRILSGEEIAVFPLSKKRVHFSRKSSSQQNNHLGDIISYLEERYKVLGIETRRQPFTWRGIPQSNLIAIIPGKNRSLSPLVFADHFDTAIAEDHYEKTKERISNPGADDNATATASLLRAAKELNNKTPERDIWLLHLTGEEFPGDDLGARHFLKELLKEKQDIAGMVLIDMIGIRDPKDLTYQINGGKSKESLELSKIAMQAAKSNSSPFVPAFRHRFSDQSYLYNTDGYIADSLGFPVVFFNEHLNRYTMGQNNLHYHQTTDLSPNLDFDYATHISKVAITTLWNAALK